MDTSIRVVDAIMGTGKSSAAITYMNEHPTRKFIYITPYLTEATRIKEACPKLKFIEPSNKLSEYQFKKILHTEALIENGRNITTTHQAFKNYSQNILSLIKEKQYTLIIDENVDVLDASDVHPADLQLAMEAGYIKEDDGVYSLTSKEYKGKALQELFGFMKNRELVRITDKGEERFFYWTLPPVFLEAFEDIFILTYLFKGQSLHHLITMYNMPYKRIGVELSENGVYRFSNDSMYVPNYVYNLKNMIHILDKDKMNEIGDDYYALSMNWFKRKESDVEQLKKNISNCYNNIWRDSPSDSRLCGAYNQEFSLIRGKGYSKSFLSFNAKATNLYRSRDHLVYAVNLFMGVKEKKFFEAHGIEVDEDMYALSIMVQWIWRSAIRDGKEIYIYIPSRRMRNILIDWINKTVKGEIYN